MTLDTRRQEFEKFMAESRPMIDCFFQDGCYKYANAQYAFSVWQAAADLYSPRKEPSDQLPLLHLSVFLSPADAEALSKYLAAIRADAERKGMERAREICKAGIDGTSKAYADACWHCADVIEREINGK